MKDITKLKADIINEFKKVDWKLTGTMNESDNTDKFVNTNINIELDANASQILISFIKYNKPCFMMLIDLEKEDVITIANVNYKLSSSDRLYEKCINELVKS